MARGLGVPPGAQRQASTSAWGDYAVEQADKAGAQDEECYHNETGDVCQEGAPTLDELSHLLRPQVRQLLRPLVREWQSARLGHVRVVDPQRHGLDTSGVVSLWAVGGTGVMWGAIGQVDVQGGWVRLETWRPFKSTLWLDGPVSRRRRVVWRDDSGKHADCWDARLLDTAHKAAKLFEASPPNQKSFLDCGLTHLRWGAEVTTSPHTVGLCIATMNRLWQLRRALPLNLLQCWPHRQWVTVHVVDFGSSDGTMEFLLKRCRAAMDCGLLRVYRADVQFWHASVAKNTAHAVASEDILVNCDVDNLLGPGFPQEVARRLAGGASCLRYDGCSGTRGRIACWRTDFDTIRGYDEDCFPIGAQDVDLKDRLSALPGANLQWGDNCLQCTAIPNSQKDKICNCAPLHGWPSWREWDAINRELFKQRLARGQVVRNLHRERIGVPAARVLPSASADAEWRYAAPTDPPQAPEPDEADREPPAEGPVARAAQAPVISPQALDVVASCTRELAEARGVDGKGGLEFTAETLLRAGLGSVEALAAATEAAWPVDRQGQQQLPEPLRERARQLRSPEPEELSPLLRPLAREWQSARLGHVVAELPSGGGRAVSLWATGAGRVPMGQADVQGSWVRLQLWGPRGGTLWLDRQASRRRRVMWLDDSGGLADCWDGRLLDTARAAAEWVEESPRRQRSWLDLGLPHLRGDAELTTSPHTVGLCITSMNRLWQLRRALPLNLVHCWPHRQWVTVHVVDFGSSDGTMDFLLTKCRAAMDCGLLRVYKADLQFWHASVAKNTAHAVASEDILVNCDGDNLLGPGFPQDVARRLADGATCLQYSGDSGTCGRIACWRADFDRMRGYDEDCYPMGAQDIDLMHRLKALPGGNLVKVQSRFHCGAIPNSIDAKICNCAPLYGQIRWGQMDTINRRVFEQRLGRGQVVRNLHRETIGVPAARVLPPGGSTKPASPRRGRRGDDA